MSQPLNVFAPNTIIKSQPANDNFSGLSTGAMDADSNSLALARKYGMYNFAASGLTIATSSSLASTIAAGIAFINASYIALSNTPKTFTASKDTYVDLKDDGTLAYVEVANGATTGMTLTTNSDGSDALRLGKVVTSASAVTSVTQLGFDTLGNMFYRTCRVFTPVTADGGTCTAFNHLGQIAKYASGAVDYCRAYTRVPNDIDTSYGAIRITLPMYAEGATTHTFSWFASCLGYGDNLSSPWNLGSAIATSSYTFSTLIQQDVVIDISTSAVTREKRFAFAIRCVSNTQPVICLGLYLEYRPKFGELR